MKPKSFCVKLNHEGRAFKRDFQKLPRNLSRIGIYVISEGGEVLRVGESSSGEKRLLRGFRYPLRLKKGGKESKNYSAYDWRENYSDQSLKIDFFKLGHSRFLDNNSGNHFRKNATTVLKHYGILYNTTV